MRGHGPGQETLQVGKREVTIAEIEAVGHYAIRPKFSDGHDTGIYSWDYLYDLGDAPRGAVGAISRALDAAGASRDVDAARRCRARRTPAATALSAHALRHSEALSDKTDFGFEQVAPDEKARRVRGVFESVAGKYDLMNDLMSAGMHRALEALHRRDQRRARRRAACSTSPAAPPTWRACSPDRVGATGSVVLTDINGAMLCRGTRPPAQRRTHRSRRAMRRRGAAFSGHGSSIACASPSACATSRARKPRSPRCAACCGPVASRSSSSSAASGRRCSRAYDWYSFNVLPRLGKAVAGDEASYRYLAESIRMHPDQQALKAMMEQAGFERVDWFNLAAGVVALHRGCVF